MVCAIHRRCRQENAGCNWSSVLVLRTRLRDSLWGKKERKKDLPSFLAGGVSLLAIYSHKDSIMKLYLRTFILIISQ